MERLEKVAKLTGGRALELDVTNPDSVDNFAGNVERVDVLINNAGLALGLDPLERFSEEDVTTMWETNVLGLLRVTRALLPKLEASGGGHIVNLGSTAGREAYPGGGGYTASKHAVRVITQTLRLELLGRPIRVTEVAPGMVETEFSVVRFKGDADKAKKVYEGLTPLGEDDIADCIAWAVTRPPHVNIDEIVLRPIAQATSTVVARKPSP
jgi:NADP-dependent 3-hydroxy acid dehydrogenase YdfG